MRRGGHCAGATGFGSFHDEPARLGESGAEVSNRVADPRVGLDLRAQELRHHLVRAALPFAPLHDRGIGIGDDVPRFRIDKEKLLLDAEREFQTRFRHRTLHAGRQLVF